jgi:hypothetical protein
MTAPRNRCCSPQRSVPAALAVAALVACPSVSSSTPSHPWPQPQELLANAAAQATTATTTATTSNHSCFASKLELELELAVVAYLDSSSNHADSDVAEQYGWPMNAWCVSHVDDFSYLFSPVNNADKLRFIESLADWDTRGARGTSPG